MKFLQILLKNCKDIWRIINRKFRNVIFKIEIKLSVTTEFSVGYIMSSFIKIDKVDGQGKN